jgi:hypothetical protein
MVRELGLNISGLRTIFYLTAWPMIETIAVFLGDTQEDSRIDQGWTYDPIENRVLFTDEAVPSEDTTIFITYTRSNLPPTQQSGTNGPPPGDDDDDSGAAR